MSMTSEVQTDAKESATTPARDELKRAYLHMGFCQYDEALAACERAADHAPKHHLPVALKGSFEMAAGRVRDALGTLRQATRRFPDEPLAQIYFAEACFVAGRRRQAQRALNRAEKMERADSFAEMIAQLRNTWQAVDPSEVPPPLVADFDGEAQDES